MQDGRPQRRPPRTSRRTIGYFIVLATLLSTPLTLPPTLVMAAIAATAISEAISVYSMAVAPCSDFITRRKIESIGISFTNAPTWRRPFDIGAVPAVVRRRIVRVV